jgi:hypothetical protein
MNAKLSESGKRNENRQENWRNRANKTKKKLVKAEKEGG